MNAMAMLPNEIFFQCETLHCDTMILFCSSGIWIDFRDFFPAIFEVKLWILCAKIQTCQLYYWNFSREIKVVKS